MTVRKGCTNQCTAWNILGVSELKCCQKDFCNSASKIETSLFLFGSLIISLIAEFF